MKFLSHVFVQDLYICPMANPELTTVFTATYSQELYFFKASLEDAGIKTYGIDELTVDVDPLISNAVGGVKLKVANVDVDKASAIIKGIQEQRKERDATAVIRIEGSKFERYLEECPKCNGEENVYKEKLGYWKSIKASFSKVNYYCSDCKHHWKQDQ